MYMCTLLVPNYIKYLNMLFHHNIKVLSSTYNKIDEKYFVYFVYSTLTTHHQISYYILLFFY